MTSRCECPASLRFASCYVYSPTGTQRGSQRSRLLCARLKRADPELLAGAADRVRRQVQGPSELAGYVGPHAWLVPVPRCTPLRAGDGGTPPEQLAAAILGQGLGRSVQAILCRRRAVPRSSAAAPGLRPTLERHYQSFALAPLADALEAPSQIVLIDDVICKGRTLLAAAWRLAESYPAADIRAFALLRAVGFVQDVERLLMPCVGEIRCRSGDAYRQP